MSEPKGSLRLSPSQALVLAFLELRPGQFFRPRAIFLEQERYAASTIRAVLPRLRDAGLVKHFRETHSWGVAGPSEFLRYSYGFRWEEAGEELVKVIPIHQKYFGALVQAWSGDADTLSEAREKLKQRLHSELEDWLGYEEGDWWFLVDSGEGLQSVPFNKTLEGRFEWRIEADDGSVVRQGSGDLDGL